MACCGWRSREDLQRRFGHAPLGTADGPAKNAIFGGNSARLYGVRDREAWRDDEFSRIKSDYTGDHQARAGGRSNLRYGYVREPAR